MILGIGNMILRDDGIGPRLIQELRNIISDPDIALRETSLSGINLMELLTGFDHAIIIDAIQTGARPGEIHWLAASDFATQHGDVSSNHNMNLFQAIELGRDLGEPMPKEITIVAIEAENVTDFGEALTLEVESTIPVALEQILAKINKGKEPLRSRTLARSIEAK